MAHIGAVLSAPWAGAFIWTLVASCLRTEAARRGVRLSSLSAKSVAEQVEELDRLIDGGVDVLVMKPMATNDPQVSAVLRKARAAGVPVITLDSTIDDEAVVCTVGSDNAKAQALATEYVFRRLGGKGRVAYFGGDPRLPSGATRNASFQQVLAAHPDIELVHEAMLDWVTPMSRQAHGADLARAALAEPGGFDALISASDEAALGAIAAIAEAGLTGRVLVTGFDALPDALLAIRDDTLAATIRQMPMRIAARAFDVALAAIAGIGFERVVRVDTELVTSANVIEAALDSLRLVPGLIFDLSETHKQQREWQQAVIARQSRILKTVVAVSNAVSRIREPGQMAQTFCDLVREDFGLRQVSMYVMDAGEAAAATLSLKAANREGRSSSVGEAPSVSLAERPLFAECVRRRATQVAGANAELALPLMAAERVIGLLHVEAAKAEALGGETIEILEAIAYQIAIALENANLYAETVRLAESELRESKAKLVLAERAEFLSYHDALTGLPNRRLFNKLLDQAISQSRRYKRQLAVLFLDLDRFKQINDTLGHEAGDTLLQQAAERLKACLRDSDTVARLGGDEFVVLLPELADPQHPATVAQKVITAIGRPFTLIGHEFRVTASIGISVYPEDGRDEQTLTKNADIAMYHAKKEGKNNFQFYSQKLNTNSLERLSLEASLRHALERNEFRLHYQAKRDTGSGRVTGMEVLLRWQHPDLGLVLPMQFIAVAEDTGLIVPLGKWVLRTACMQNVAWQGQGLSRLVVSVNLAPRQFLDEALVSDLRAILAETGMSADLLELEITEKTLMHDNERTLRILKALKQEGVR
ncbi:MAG: diguanylate cyclase domain-containing protein, partial [Rhizobacter sp.]